MRCRATNTPEQLEWLAVEVDTQQENCEKTLIFGASINSVSEIYTWLMGRLRQQAYRDGVANPRQSLISMFHAHVSPELQQHILTVFRQKNSTIRVIVCTIAFGMGVEVPDVRRVVHWGRVKSVLSFWQQVGRCGRDGLPAQAMWYPSSVTGDDREVFQHMKNGSKCVRRTILEAFVLQPGDTEQLDQLDARQPCAAAGGRQCAQCACSLCSCCSYCRAQCSCSASEE